MTNLTMGQRIAAQRKLKAMSQETLAQQLEVSRQAVSKWESDAAIPEVDKLIALGKLFGVSVGWLLGTETECRYDPDAGLNESQIRMVEEIVARSQPKKSIGMRLLAAACVVILFLGTALHYQGRIDELAAANTASQTQLAELTAANQQIQSQLDEMNAMLAKQDSAGKLLSDYGITSCYLSEDLSQISMTLVLTPKVYLEETAASVAVTGPGDFRQSFDCSWNGAQYLAHIQIPVMDGCEFRLILSGAGSWKEENLNEVDPSLALIGTLSGFHIDPDHEMFERVRQHQAAPWSVDDTVYTFSAPICPPFVLPRDSGLTFLNTRFVLFLNGKPVWEELWKEEFSNPYGYWQTYGYLMLPEISAELPALSAGDEILLVITADLPGGQKLETVLDRRIVE